MRKSKISFEKMKTVILAGGKGTRLYPLLNDIPKPMLPINHAPLLFHIIRHSQKHGFHRFIMKTNHLSHVIEDYFGDGERFGCQIEYFIEKEPLGTAGGLKYLEKEKEPVMILYGDVALNFNLRKLIEYHINNGAQATLVIHESNHPEDSDVVVLDEKNQINKIIHKPGNKNHGNMTNAALYVLNPECFSLIPENGNYDFGKDILPKLIEHNFKVLGYESNEYMKDVGTIKRYEELQKDIALGKVFNRVDSIFLDRDGTINEEIDLLHRINDFRFIEGVSEAIKKINDQNIPTIVISNQSVVARNICSESEVNKINNYMRSELIKRGAYIDAVFFCPHHPEKNHADGNPKYRIDCECRKPKTGMFLEAKKKFNIDLKKSFMIGDTTGDVLAGKNAGCRTILVRTGYGGKDKKYDVVADFEFDSLNNASEFIEKYNKTTIQRIIEDISRKKKEKERVVVLIAGCSRTGKSTLAKSIIEEFNDSMIVNLDGWLISNEKRPKDSKVYERYNYTEIIKDIKSLMERNEVDVPTYNQDKRRSESKEKVRFQKGVLVIEGVVALDIQKLREIADIKIFKDESDEIRISRLKEYFEKRPIPDDEKEKNILEREKEEIPYIKRTCIYADYIL